MARPTPVFETLSRLAEAPQTVRVFEQGRFLYASYHGGCEQVLDVRAHDRVDLLRYWLEWMKGTPRRERTPERNVVRNPPAAEPQPEYLTSLRPKRRMTLDEFLAT